MDFCSSTFNDLLAQYTDSLGFAWRQRQLLLENAEVSFGELHRHDMRMEAMLCGLRGLDEEGALQTLQRFDEPLIARELFAYTVQALVARQQDLLEACVALAGSMENLRDAFIDAACWVEPAMAQAALQACRDYPELRQRFLLRLLADAPLQNEQAIVAESANALTLIPELARSARYRSQPEWFSHAPTLLRHGDPAVSTAAIRHLLLFGNDEERKKALYSAAPLALTPGGDGDLLACLLTAESEDAANALLARLRRSEPLQRRYLLATGWAGRIAAVPELMALLDDERRARPAAQALTLITGALPQHDGWQGAAPPAPPLADHALPAADPDEELPWPDRSAFESWWRGARAHFSPDQRYLLGQPRSPVELLKRLCGAPLRYREAAAWLLQRTNPQAAIDVALPGWRQQERLNSLAFIVGDKNGQSA